MMRPLGVLSAFVCAFSIQAATAADMPLKARRGVVYEAPYTWTGFQLGAQGGYGWSRETWQNTTLNTLSTSGTIKGGFAGVRGGYDYQINNFVVGVSGEYNFANINGTFIFNDPIPDSVNIKIKNFGSVDGRIGYSLGNYLIYAIGGYAFGRLENTYFGLGNGTPFPAGTTTISGWDVGAGLDVMLWRNIVGRVEYRHYEFKDKDFAALAPGFSAYTIKSKMDTVRLGVAYKF